MGQRIDRWQRGGQAEFHSQLWICEKTIGGRAESTVRNLFWRRHCQLQLGGIAASGDGSVYVTGATQDTNFPITPHAFQTHPSMEGIGNNAFVLKMPTFIRMDINGDGQPD